MTDETTERRLEGMSFPERLRSLYENRLYADCQLCAEGRDIFAHRMVLALASPQLEELLLNRSPLLVPVSLPFSFHAVEQFIRYCYSLEMRLDHIHEAFDVIQVAEYFDVNDLITTCCSGIQPKSLSDFWPCLDLACRHDSSTLQERCLQLALDTNSQAVLNDDGFLHADPKTVAFLLSRDVLKDIPEVDVIKRVVAWAQYRIRLPGSPNVSLRLELDNNDILKHLRIFALKDQEFNNFLDEYGIQIFSETELINIKEKYVNAYLDENLCKISTSRILEEKISVGIQKYFTVSCQGQYLDIPVRVFQSKDGIRPIVKTLTLPCQLNTSTMACDNTCPTTHYTEHLVVRLTVNNQLVASGVVQERVRYFDSVVVTLTSVDCTPLYSFNKYDHLANDKKCYEANIRINFNVCGHYPLLDENLEQEPKTLIQTDGHRFIYDIILSYTF